MEQHLHAPAAAAASDPAAQQLHDHQQSDAGASSPRNNSKKKKRARKLKQPRTVDMPRVLAEMLREPKQPLLHRVVRIIGPKEAWDLLKETLRVEQQGGLEVNAYQSGVPDKFLVEDEQTQEKKPRKRTTGGIYFTLLRDKVPKETYREIYEVENKKKKEARNRIKYQKKQRFDNEISQLGFDVLNIEPETAADRSSALASSTDGGYLAFQSSYGTAEEYEDGEQEEGEVEEMVLA